MPEDPSRIALVLGAHGGVGGETALALARHGWTIRALVRDPSKAPRRADWSYVVGDAMNRDTVVAAAGGAGLIVHAVNPPGYRGWNRLVLPMIDNTIAAAETNGARILLPGTIYNYGRDAYPLLSEESPQRPATRKGEIRVRLEARLEAAAARGVRALVLRAGDYFGRSARNNWFSQALVKPGQKLKAVTYPGAPGVGHAWAYLPDVAETFARLAEREADLPVFARFHFDGQWDADGTAMTSAIRRVAGAPDVPIRAFPWGLLRLIAPFNETVRELIEMRPLWRQAARLDNRRLVAFLGAEPRTPLEQAIRETLTGLDVPLSVTARGTRGVAAIRAVP
ncbi:NAD(P)H-binding protein [Aquabacter spiritensis]|uniref:Nucleoside-diphosphate-sugar epimerase n=1 Tax=Aquabacter spiritensis TaxID=933073 RepID=A0A4R3LWI1_9HYPH|nr:NAD(P)H-binding protein [Aquabacter spiritensis]TCT04991.1 nucleoside-diphosphate-sugar epimerase [Aquabacter spiritensis]